MFSLVARQYDAELSRDVIEHLLPLCDCEPEEVLKRIEECVQANESMLRDVFTRYRESSERSIFLYQPECLLILERLENANLALEARWRQRYPMVELDKLATILGRPLRLAEDG